ncbi:hydroxyacid dehydrogenase [Candidatus Desantisbacteria bacterium CG_4_10_14_0_8_um_filter_48_22]|uniref:Hydroxyacid dehydrogenase n=1 Tax=Candidatus Desantisbacteria bacterium CG_4_10_14_0_8_um_filter_48_22 TaxID=1974543 RepID=A0A2M7SBI6_9BACT|nr:MAG: hydroxyacid dehydrogenase [Candidatus Desantisbacteria bacterium CG1_02_49_89]PIV55212.1 MAG: hydroxyacid dehydrogenase [Candidatus Desantisbacteria bacterium CG02_land_8_20_14_3_00_49_13]PIZ16858.1 MAG: hydroxyacid dehydrogenase [Candidatus Desantisbacteria bacterium CG_4_10_14_0_8_um_filter_48_22]
MKIAVVNSDTFGKYFPEHLERLSKIGKTEKIRVDRGISGMELAKKLAGFNIVIASISPVFSPEFFKNNEDIILISRHGVGCDNIDGDSATGAGVVVTKVPGNFEEDSVAEHAVALLFDVARKICPAASAVKNGKWSDRAKFLGIEITGKKVGIIGLGEIGTRFAEIMKKGFGTEILAYDPKLGPEEIRKRGAEPVYLEQLVKEADIISLHCPLTDETRGILGEKEFAGMKQGVIIINTARGGLIDEKALAKYLGSGKVSGAGLDVVENEPADAKHPLLKYENVVLVPHIAAYTVESLKKMGDKVVEDAEKAARKEIPDGVVNTDVLNRNGLRIRNTVES